MKEVSIALTGDSFITQRLPRDSKFAALQNFLGAHDVRFTNFEILLHDFEVYPAPVSGGTWAVARPAVLQRKDVRTVCYRLWLLSGLGCGCSCPDYDTELFLPVSYICLVKSSGAGRGGGNP